jgi:hypothetical protein
MGGGAGGGKQGGPQMGGGPGGPGGGAPQMGGGPGGGGQAQAAPTLAEKLTKFALASGPVADKDMAGIRDMIEAVCAEISTSIKSAGHKVDYQAIKSGLLGLQDWLKKQGCVGQASTRYAIESTDKYPTEIFETYPGTVAFDVAFKQAGNAKKLYRLLLFVTTVDLFSFGSLEENRTTAGIPVPKNWPQNPWSYWTDRP